MPEIPAPETTLLGAPENPVLWEATVLLNEDEINPDVLRTVNGMLLDALEEAVEAADGAANWGSFMIHMTHKYRIWDAQPPQRRLDTYTRVSASVRAL